MPTKSVDVLWDRRRERDGVEGSEGAIQELQEEETDYATKVAATLQIPITVCRGARDHDAIAFISEAARR